MNFVIIPPYPLHEFHLIVKNAAEEVRQHVQVPEALVAMAFLSSMSASAQGLYDVRIPTGQIRPVSLDLLAVADSGDRKTATDNLVAAPLYAFDKARIEKHIADIKKYEARLSIWRSVEVGLQRQVTRLTQDGKSIDAVCRQLFDHMAVKPVRPRLRCVMHQNATPRAIMDDLEGNGESIAFISDEGEIIFKSGVLNLPGMLNKAWDGDRLTLDRSDGVKIIADNPRITVFCMVQPRIFEKFLDRRGDVMRGSGHWARYLVAYPASIQGTRFKGHLDIEWRELPKFHARMRELLDEFGHRIDSGLTERMTLEFSEDAVARWICIANQVERDLGPLGHLHDIKDFASKFMEIAGRVAALFHVFSKQEGKISVDTLERAVSVVEWHADEFKRIFSPEAEIPQEYVDAQVLENYLYTQYWRRNFNRAQKNLVLKNGPIRPVSRLDAALNCLIDAGAVWIGIGQRRERYINFNSAHFGPLGTNQMASRF